MDHGQHKRKYRPIMSLLITMLITGVLLRVFVVDTFTVSGNSMAPTFVDGDYIFVNKLAYWGHTPERGDIVTFNFRDMTGLNAVKRVVGLPGDWLFIDTNQVYIRDDRGGNLIDTVELYDKMYVNMATSSHYRLDAYEYYLVGDNGLISTDSRELGPVDIYKIQGKVLGAWRMSEMKWISPKKEI